MTKEKIFPLNFRRTRQNSTTRDLFSDIKISKSSLIQPYFVVEGLKAPRTISALRGQWQHTTDSLKKELTDKTLPSGVRSILLFIVPEEKNKRSKDFNYDYEAEVISELKKHVGNDLVIWTDLCLCSNTLNGHCGIMDASNPHLINNHKSVLELTTKGLILAEAGSDGIAPADMMDDRVAALRERLDDRGQEHTMIMSYSSKFASNLYGPFRAAASSHPISGDRKSYQLDPSNTSMAIRSSVRDFNQGADIIMVKPATFYLDIIYRLKNEVAEIAGMVPIAAYQVSGEYQALSLLADAGLCSFSEVYSESLVAIKRAGADLIITYGATSM